MIKINEYQDYTDKLMKVMKILANITLIMYVLMESNILGVRRNHITCQKKSREAKKQVKKRNEY